MMRYGVLFDVAIRHDYFLNRGSVVHEALPEDQRIAVMRSYDLRKIIDVFPTERTRKRLAGHNMIFKNTASGFLVGVKMDSSMQDDRPAIVPNADFHSVFALRIKDPVFFNYTALPGPAKSFYRFSNNSANAVATEKFLSVPVPAFDASRTYESGEVYADSSASTAGLFRAIRDTGPSDAPIDNHWERIPCDTWNSNASYAAGAVVLYLNCLYRALVKEPGSDLQDATRWEYLGALTNQYVTTADSLRLIGNLFNLDLSGKQLKQATVRLSRIGEFIAAFEKTYAAAGDELLGIVQLDLRNQPAGLYELQVLNKTGAVVSGIDARLYLDSEAIREGWFGVIEIGLGSGELALLNDQSVLQSPSYTLRFLNRATRWRYIFPSPQKTGSGTEVMPENGDNRFLATEQPRPLTRFGTGLRLQADDPGTEKASEEVLLPEPETNRIRHQNAQWWSEIHVSNLRV